MPTVACIAQAAEDYRYNNSFLLNTVKDLTAGTAGGIAQVRN